MVSPCVFWLSELNEVLNKLNQGPSLARPPIVETTDTSVEDTDTSQPRRTIRSKRTLKMKKSYTTSELARFLVTGPTDASTKLSEFYCRLCRNDVSVLTHGSSEVLRHFQGIRHFARDQRLRLETPGWRVLGFDGKPLTEGELERQREKSLRASLVVPWGLDSGCFRKHWPSNSCARQGFVPSRCTPAGRELRVGWTSVVAVCRDGQPS